MKKTLNQELKDAFQAMDAERVKSLMTMGADKNRHVRNDLLMASCGARPPYKPKEVVLTGDEKRDAEAQKRYDRQAQKYNEDVKAQNAHLQYMQLLLVNGANPNQNDYEETLLMKSLSMGNFAEAQVLLDNGANINKYFNKDTLLTWYAGRLDYDADLDTIKFLYKNGALLDAKDKRDGKTPLMNMTGFNGFSHECAFEDLSWLIKPIEFVVAHGARVNLRDRSGKTALVHSLNQKWGNWPANYDWFDESALKYKDKFSETFYYEIPTILLSNGARVNVADNNGKNAIHAASTDDNKMELFARAVDESNRFLRRKIVVMSR